MDFEPLSFRFPELGPRETRFVEVRGNPYGIPNGTYDFVELYCVDPSCACRRVRVCVFCREDKVPGVPPEALAVLEWRWPSRPAPEREPARLLDSPVEYGKALLGLFEELLEDPAYAERVVAHYQAVRETLPAAPAVAPKRRSKRKLKRKKKKR